MQVSFEEQTERIVKALFSSLKAESQVADRCLELQNEDPSTFEVDSASGFDPGYIANTLRSLGDQLEDQVQEVIAKKSKEKPTKFKEIAESLSRSLSRNNPGLEYEIAFLAIAVKLFENIIKKTAVDEGLLTETINTNTEVRNYIERQGGWGNVARGLNHP